MKKLFLKFLYKCIEVIEKIQYRNLDLDENDISKKILEEYDLTNVKLLSDDGYVEASQIYLTQPYKHVNIILEDGKKLSCADNHIVFTPDLKEVFVKDLSLNDEILTIDGAKKVTSIEFSNIKTSMFDVSINTKEHRYYTNGILSHNTINAAIFILHFITFNSDKNVMIAANKFDTVKEILQKVKDIYVQLPFFLKAGVRNMNQKNMVFGDTGCRIKSTARSKEPAIGFTIDLLYLDEFAHIPKSIINPFYRAIYPTVAAVNNSKIIVTSTPNGFNLFHDILSKAELPEGHPQKNAFAPMRVYYDQVPGRNVTYVRLNEVKMRKLNIEVDDIYDLCKEKWNKNDEFDSNNIPYTLLRYDEELDKDVINILHRIGVNVEEIRKEVFEFNGKKFKLAQVAEIESWEEMQIKNIGSQESFNQEFNLQFITGSKLLFDKQYLKLFAKREVEFEHLEFDHFDERLSIEYKELEFVKDKSIFDIDKVKDYYVAFSIDTAEGLGQDYTVINMFKLVHKTEKEIMDYTFNSTSDYFRLEQIGVYHCNLMGPAEVAEVLYMLVFELFDPEKCKITLELNGPGGELLAHMESVFGGDHDYGSFVFARYKHKANDKKRKVGFKLNRNKGTMVKEYQKRLKASDIVVHHKENIKEIKNFIKSESSAGNLKFEAETGHDDLAITVVNLAGKFLGSVEFRNMVESYMSYDLEERIRLMIEKKMDGNQYSKNPDYSSLKNNRHLLNNNKRLPYNRNQ